VVAVSLPMSIAQDNNVYIILGRGNLFIEDSVVDVHFQLSLFPCNTHEVHMFPVDLGFQSR
jgi:hypothetical protein